MKYLAIPFPNVVRSRQGEKMTIPGTKNLHRLAAAASIVICILVVWHHHQPVLYTAGRQWHQSATSVENGTLGVSIAQYLG